MLQKIISGGQTGADLGGLKAGKILGLETGGWLPRGCKTLAGPRPQYLELFGMVEHKSDRYAPRTFSNARDSGGTIRFASNWNSPGELCTLKAINQYKKPYFDVSLTGQFEWSLIDEARAWILEHDIKVLNVAGNSEQTSPGAEKTTECFLKMLGLSLVGVEKGSDAATYFLAESLNREIDLEIKMEILGL